MADLIINVNPLITTIHDETFGLQNDPAELDTAIDDNGNDIAVSSLPTVFSDLLTDLGANPSGAIGAALSGYDGSNSGLDVFTIDTGGSTVTNLALTDANGDPLDGLDSGLTTTLGGNTIFLYTDPTNDNIVLGREGTGTTADPNGNIALAIYLDENTDLTAGKIWTVQYEAIFHNVPGDGTTPEGSYDEPLDLTNLLFVTASQDLEFDLSNSPSGQNLFIMFGDGNITDGGAEVGIVATGRDPANQSDGESITTGDTVNTSQAGGPTTFGVNNQMLTASAVPGEGDGIYYTFVTGPNPDFTVPNLTQTEADVEANIEYTDYLNAKAAEFQVVQLQGGKTADVKVSAYIETVDVLLSSGVNFVDELNNDPLVPITSAVVFDFDGGGELNGADNGDGTFTILPDGDGTVTITGAEAGDTITYFTDGDHNRVLIENVGDGRGQDSANFDIGGFQLIQADATTAEVGSTVHWEDDGPSATVTADGTEPGTVYLFDGNQANGNFEGDNGTGLPTGDAARDGSPTSVTVAFAGAFNMSTSVGADGGSDATTFSLVLGVAEDTQVVFNDGTNDVPATSGGVAVDWLEVTAGSVYAGVLTGTTTEVFRLSVDANGEVTFSQTDVLDHTRIDSGSPYSTDILTLDDGQISVEKSTTATDGDGDTATDSAAVDLGGNFAIGDDGPTVTVTADGTEPGTVYLFDGNQANGNFEGDNGTGAPTADAARDGAPTSVTVAFAPAFNMSTSVGADGGSDATTFSLVLDVAVGTQVVFNDGTNDVPATSGGTAVDWAEVTPGSVYAGVLTGTTTEVFRLAVAANGEVTFSQTDVLDHTRIDSGSPYSTDILTLDDGQISVEKSTTATDGDGDTATDSAAVDLGGNFAIGDDGPTVTVTADGTEPGTVYLFDGNQANGNFEGDNGTGAPTADAARDGAPTSVTVAFAPAFNMSTSVGADGGSDATTFSLVLDVAVGTQVVFNDGTNDVPATSGGVAVDWLEVTAGSVYAGVLTGTTTEVFRLSVDANGEVTFSQTDVLDHTRIDSGSPYSTDILTLDDGQISVEKSTTATDGDGDTATDSAAVDLGGNFAIGDDGPTVTVTADGTEPGTVYLFDGNQANGNFEGDNGTGAPTADAARDGAPTSVTVAFAPAFNMSTSVGADGGSDATTFSLVLDVAVGTQVVFNDGTNDVPATSGGVAVDWLEVTAGSVYAGVLTGTTTEVFRLSVDANGEVTFSQTDVLDHTRIDSGSPYSTDILTLDDGQISVEKSTTATDGDGDTATDSAAVDLGGNFAIGDDGPTVTVTADGTEPGTVYLFDGNQANGNFEGDNGTGLPTGDAARDGSPTSVTVAFAGAFNMSTSFGADGGSDATTFSLVLGVAEDTQVVFNDGTNDVPATSGGVAVDWLEVTAGSVYAGVLTGTTTEVFRLSVDANGEVTFSQTDVLDHTRLDSGSPYSTDILTLDDGQISVEKSTTATDGDGDTATDSAAVDLGGNFAIGDDGPTVTVTADGTEPGTVYLFDGNQANGNFEGDNGTGAPTADAARDGAPTSVTVAFAPAFNMSTSVGADGGSDATTFSLVLDVAVGTQVVFNDGTNDVPATSGGTAVDWAEVTPGSVYAGVLTGTTTEVFRLAVAANGEVTFSQTDVLDHTRLDSGSPFTTDILTLDDGQISIEKSTTATDGDGDTATDSDTVDLGGNFAIGDDGPTLEFSNLVGTVTTTPQIGFWDGPAGADQPGTLTITAEDSDPQADGINFDMVNPDGDASTGTVVFDNFDGTTGTGTLTADFDNDPGNGDETIGFSLTVNTDGTYDFALDEVIVPVVTLSTDEGQLPAGGPDPVQTLSFVDTDFVFFAVDAGTASAVGNPSDIGTPRPLTMPPASETPNSPIGLGEPDLTEAELQALSAMVNIEGTGVNGTGDFPFIRDEIEMNVSTSGIGVGNNVLQGEDLPGDDPGTINPFGSGAFDESFVINPEPLASEVKVFVSKTAGGFEPPGSGATLAKTDYLYWNLYDELGNNSGPILVNFADVLDEADVAAGGTGENLWSFTIDIDEIDNAFITGDSIDAVQFTMGFGNIKIPKIEVVVRGDEPPNDIFLDFSAKLTDADGDMATSDFAIDLFGNDVGDMEMFDYTLVDAGAGPDAFNADEAGAGSNYLVQGFDTDEDTLVLLNLADGFELETEVDGDGDGLMDDSRITSNDGPLSVVVQDATLTLDNITEADTLI